MPPTWIFVVLGVGAVSSAALFATIRNWERHETEKCAADLVHEQVEKLEMTMLRSMEVLHAVASLHKAYDGLDRAAFSRFVREALERQSELLAVSWNPCVSDAQRKAFEAAAVAEGFPDFQLREKTATGEFHRAGERGEYVPVYLIEPLAGNTAALGYDLDSDPERRRSLEQARDSGKFVATAPIQLAQCPKAQNGFLVLLPVYSGFPETIAERRERLSGFAVAVFRVDKLVGTAFDELQRRGITAKLFDSASGSELIHERAAEPFGRTAATVRVDFAGREWRIVFLPTKKLIAMQSHFQSRLVLACGLIFTFLTAGYFYGNWRRTKEVAAANAALQEEVAVRQQAEASAEAANRAKSDFLASMSHEIRTPLNAILGYTQLMQRDPHLPLEQRDAVGGVSASGRHLLGLINEILDLAKIEAGQMELHPINFDLSTLAGELAATFRPLCAEKKIRFRLEVKHTSDLEKRENRSTTVRGDEGKLRQVLINLLGNAAKFTSSGEICLRISTKPDDGWLFEVIDTGMGIPEEEQKEIFQPFHQGSGAAHQGGTGLGLAIAKRQVELLGGKLELESERGIGSRFFFEVSLTSGRGVLETTGPRIVRLAEGNTVCALVVDDRKENRDVLGGMLLAIGCEVVSAGNAEEAFAAVRSRKVSIVFLDLLLPGVGGVEAARMLLESPSNAGLKIVMHTASTLTRHREESLAAGCVDFITKPFSCEEIYLCLQKHLRVEFEYAAAGEAIEAELQHELPCVQLPEQLCARLTVAAELHSATALKACLVELRQRDSASQQLAEAIRERMRSYDMDGIQRLLAEHVLPIQSQDHARS